MKRLMSVLCLFALFVSVPASAQMQGGLTASPQQSTPRFILAGQLGFGGEIEFEIEGQSIAGDADTSFGGLAEFSAPLHDLFMAGVRVSFSSVSAEEGDGDTVDYLSFYAVPKLRLPVARTFELHAGVPLGFSIAFLPDEFDQVDTGLGFSWGVVGGGTLSVSPGIGLYGELGLMNPSSSLDAGEQSGTVTASQFTMIAGISINI